MLIREISTTQVPSPTQTRIKSINDQAKRLRDQAKELRAKKNLQNAQRAITKVRQK